MSIVEWIRQGLPPHVQSTDIVLLPAPKPEWGDHSCAVALGLARILKQSPQVIAQGLCDHVARHDDVRMVQAVGGYVNITYHDHVWHKELRTILNQPTTYGHSDIGHGQRVNVEYVSANPTGPLHVAHARGAILGDALSHLLQAVGYDVTREYYMNDAGVQIAVLGKTILCHCHGISTKTETVIPDGLYPGTYGHDIAVAYMRDFPQWQDQDFDHVCAYAVRMLMDQIQDDMYALDIYHTVLTSERLVHNTGLIQDMVDALAEKDLVYTGTLPPPKNHTGPWDAQPLMLFKATAVGEDDDCALQNSQGAWTYFAGDLAYHWDKVQRGYDRIIDVWGADHAGHVKRMQAALKALSGRTIDIQVMQMVRFLKAGQPLKMSKRAGTFVTLRDVLDTIDADVLRFMMLTKKTDTHLTLDLQDMQEQSKSNPIFYIQYAHARCCSIMRHACRHFGVDAVTADALKEASFSTIDDMSMAKMLTDWPRQVREAALSCEPHRLTTYLYKVAQEFHGLWHKGNEDTGHRFIQEDDEAKSIALVALSQCVMHVIRCGLAILGIRPRHEL